MDLNNFYKEKYLKYKNKYLSIGGIKEPILKPYDINYLIVDDMH